MVCSPRITAKAVDVIIEMDPSIRVGGKFQIDVATAQIQLRESYFRRISESFNRVKI
jgi:hypothetical protein